MSAPLGPNDVPREVPFTPRRTSEDVFAFNWSRQTKVALLMNKTVGILGFGEIGAELARRLQNWNCRVLYAKRNALPKFIEDDLRIEHREQEQLLRESDIVVCLLPYFKETDQWLNAGRIAMSFTKLMPSRSLIGLTPNTFSVALSVATLSTPSCASRLGVTGGFGNVASITPTPIFNAPTGM